jgi:hypothetical protein
MKDKKQWNDGNETLNKGLYVEVWEMQSTFLLHPIPDVQILGS